MSGGNEVLVLRMAVGTFLVCLPLAQWIAFRELERRGRDEELLFANNMRDHVLAALARASLWGLVATLPVLASWIVVSWRSLGSRTFLGMELFLAFLVLALGLTTIAARFALDLMRRPGRGGIVRLVFILRLAVLAVGAGYGAAMWVYTPGNLGETLLAVFLIGVALVVLGLNRTADMEPELLARLARALRRGPE